MTSRAVKHQAMLAKRANRLEAERQAGLAAQRLDHEKREHRARLAKIDADRVNRRHEDIYKAATRKQIEDAVKATNSSMTYEEALAILEPDRDDAEDVAGETLEEVVRG